MNDRAIKFVVLVFVLSTTLAYGYGSYFDRGDYENKRGDILLSYDEAELVWFNLDTPLYENATDIKSISVRASGAMIETYYGRWPINSGEPNSVLLTPGDINSQWVWATIDANLIDGNDIELPTLTPGSIIFVDANGFPLYEDNPNLYYDDVNNFVGINTNSPRDRLEVVKRFVTDPLLFNTLVGHEDGNSITVGKKNTLGGYQAGFFLDSNDNTAWGYQAVGGGGAGTAATYPTLRTTTAQADPGLTHTLAISNVTELQAMQDNLASNYYLTGNIDASATSGWNGGAGFVPIGTFGLKFTGTFDGCGYTISNLYINRNSTGQGLFQAIGANAKVANVTLSNVDIKSGYYWGGES